MTGFAEFWQQGGPWMYPVVLLFVLLFVLCGVDLLTRGRFRLINLSIACFVAILLTGCLGTVLGVVQCFEALATPGLSSDEKTKMLNTGLSISLNTSILAVFLALPGLWLVALSRVFRKAEV